MLLSVRHQLLIFIVFVVITALLLAFLGQPAYVVHSPSCRVQSASAPWLTPV
jgi:hypothetical protein